MSDKLVAIVVALGVILFALPTSAHAQQVKKKIPIIGYLTLAHTQRENEQIFVRGLRELGYIPGKNISIEWRFADGKADRLPELAADLVKVKSDVNRHWRRLRVPTGCEECDNNDPNRIAATLFTKIRAADIFVEID